ncbi:MAG: hypothetical protein GC164_02735 [Phycisphaera sp.]|nr:hypothetical protein [Phycisphaera sp.]
MSDMASKTTVEQQARRVEQRDAVETILALAQHLDPAERLLLEQVYKNGLTFTDIGRLTGQAPVRVKRRIHSLVSHLKSPLYRRMVLHGHVLPTPTRKVAQALFIRKQSYRQAARHCRLSIYQVRRHALDARRLLQAMP